MKRPLFLLIIAILTLLIGAIHIIMPDILAESNGMTASAHTAILFRLLGGMLLSIGVLNYLVRNHADSVTLKAVLICNIVNHAVNFLNDISSVYQGLAGFADSIPVFLVHIFIGAGSYYFITKMGH